MFLQGAHPAAFAHRGFAPDGAENSLAAFARAVDLGYGYLETDARVTSDGVALAFHDDILDRVTDRAGILSRLTWSQVRGARIAGREPIPLLADVLGAFPGVRVNIDIKSGAALLPAVEAIRRTGSGDRVCVAAFSDRRLRAARAMLGPEVCTALGPAEVARLKVASRGPDAGIVRRVLRLTGRCAQVPVGLPGMRLVDDRFVRAAHSAGLAVHVWTVDDPDRMRRLLDLGVDGIMTDRADVLRTVLQERGEWR